MFAKQVDGAPVDRIGEYVVQHGSVTDCLLFASFIPGAPVEALYRRAQSVVTDYDAIHMRGFDRLMGGEFACLPSLAIAA